MWTPLIRRAILICQASPLGSDRRSRHEAPQAQDTEEPRPQEEADDDGSTRISKISTCRLIIRRVTTMMASATRPPASTSSTAARRFQSTFSRIYSPVMLMPTSRTKSPSDPLQVTRQRAGARTRPWRPSSAGYHTYVDDNSRREPRHCTALCGLVRN